MNKYRTAHFDCFSGVSGDMILGAFIDLGVPLKWLKESLSGLSLPDFDIKVETVSKKGIAAKNVSVVYDAGGCKPANLKKIAGLLDKSPLPEKTAGLSLGIFKKIAEAESLVHGCSIDEVHFHEVGAADSIIDVVGSALCLSYLGIKKITASGIPLGRGRVSCAHGILPVPTPATLEILKGVPVYDGGVEHELVTPTGAAIIKSIAESFGGMPELTIRRTGCGAGDADFDKLPNILRIILGDSCAQTSNDVIEVVEASIDDMNPEFYDLLMERLFEDGALDVCMVPVFMKKNRPAVILKALCLPQNRDAVIRRILSETTSSGARYYRAARTILGRDTVILDTSLGKIECKRITSPGGFVRLAPEYESCKKIAIAKKIPVQLVYETVLLSSGPSAKG